MELFTLKLTLESPMGQEGEDINPQHPLKLALRSLLAAGKPARDVRSIFLAPNVDAPYDWRWLGVLVHTVAGRIVFFPATESASIRIVQQSQDPQQVSFPVEHVTVERDLKSVHLTTDCSVGHWGRVPTASVGATVLAFAVNIRSPDDLPVLRKRTLLEFQIPASDARRRGRLLSEIRQNAVDVCLTLPAQPQAQLANSFVHIAVFIGVRDFPMPSNAPLALPPASACSPGGPIPRPPELVRLQRLSLTGERDIVLATMVVEGTLLDPVGITTPGTERLGGAA